MSGRILNMIRRIALFSDIHFGKHANSEQHNTDCLNYLNWFAEQVKNNDIDAVAFLGDWHEHRAAINGLTLDYSIRGAEILNNLNLPIYFIVGNHDMYYRNTRDVFTTVMFDNLDNFIMVNEPLELPDNKLVFAPFLFPEEYDPFFKQYSHCEVIMGHFEFNGFVLTGETVVCTHGADPDKYSKPSKIYSGHFHKRSSKKNVHYIGNTFPMDFGDANDFKRGMAIHDFTTGDVEYIDWEDCPKYIKASLSDVLESPKETLQKNARIKVYVDEDLTLSESNTLREQLLEKYNLREMSLEERIETTIEMSDIEKEIEDLKLEGVNQIVPELLKRIKNDKIDSEKLVEIYRSL